MASTLRRKRDARPVPLRASASSATPHAEHDQRAEQVPHPEHEREEHERADRPEIGRARFSTRVAAIEQAADDARAEIAGGGDQPRAMRPAGIRLRVRPLVSGWIVIERHAAAGQHHHDGVAAFMDPCRKERERVEQQMAPRREADAEAHRRCEPQPVVHGLRLRQQAAQWHAEAVDGLAGGEGDAAVRIEGQADQRAARRASAPARAARPAGSGRGRSTPASASTTYRWPRRVEREPLRAAEAGAPRERRSPSASDAIDRIVRAERRRGDIEMAVGPEREMERGHAGRQRGEQRAPGRRCRRAGRSPSDRRRRARRPDRRPARTRRRGRSRTATRGRPPRRGRRCRRTGSTRTGGRRDRRRATSGSARR